MKIVNSTFMPREKELRIEFSDGVVYWYDDVNKRDIDEKTAEAIRDHAQLSKKDEI